jgi:hypothetical protein
MSDFPLFVNPEPSQSVMLNLIQHQPLVRDSDKGFGWP